MTAPRRQSLLPRQRQTAKYKARNAEEQPEEAGLDVFEILAGVATIAQSDHGELEVRGTRGDLDAVEQAIHIYEAVLATQNKEVQIKVVDEFL
jgi:hypothetical protein